MNYQEAWTFLNDLQFFKIKLGLDSMNAFLQSVGHPQENLSFVHVAGTNGKGSVSVNLLTILARAGYRVGLYTSPHLSSVRERFRINDSYISEEEFAELATRIRDILNGRQITYFEFTTALAMLWFADQKVDLAIMEVGLGGRLDATNVIEPLVSVITNVSMDHEAYLGNTLKEVAGEKAGIIKPGVPVVSGVAGDDSLDVVARTCRERVAPLYLLGRDFHMQTGDDSVKNYHGIGGEWVISGLTGGLAGGYQADNLAVAFATLDVLTGKGFPVDDEVIRTALPEVRWPGRLEHFCLSEPELFEVKCPADVQDIGTFRQYLLDGAHNPAGVKCLVEYLKQRKGFRRLVVIWASMADKDFAGPLRTVASLCHRIIFTRPEEERSAWTGQLVGALPPDLQDRATGVGSVAGALAAAREMTTGEDLICVAGSLYLVGAARNILLGEVVV